MSLLAIAATVMLPLAVAAVVVVLVFGGAAVVILGLQAVGQLGDAPRAPWAEPDAKAPPATAPETF
jgi:hypothetical protein